MPRFPFAGPGSRARARSLVFISLTVVCATLAWAVASSPSRAAAHSGGYVFSEFSIEKVSPQASGDSPQFSLGYRIEWDGDVFPGLRSCRFGLIASDGSEVGHQSVQIYALDSAGRRAGTHVSLGDATRSPQRATVSCEDRRLDDPAGRYSVTNVTVVRTPTFDGDLRTLEATFDTHWMGEGLSSVNECLLEARDNSGVTLFLYPFTLDDAAGSAIGRVMRMIVQEDVVADPASADVACSPYR